MFGRRKREEAVAAEAAREADRRTLFAKLAERPENICPFLGLEADRTGYVEGVSSEHRCFAFGDPAPLSAEQQTRVCQERGYGNCPRYLRGVLVIPTEELEALRRPRPPSRPVVRPAEVQLPSPSPLLAILALCSSLVRGVAPPTCSWAWRQRRGRGRDARARRRPHRRADADARRRRQRLPSTVPSPTSSRHRARARLPSDTRGR